MDDFGDRHHPTRDERRCGLLLGATPRADGGREAAERNERQAPRVAQRQGLMLLVIRAAGCSHAGEQQEPVTHVRQPAGGSRPRSATAEVLPAPRSPRWRTAVRPVASWAGSRQTMTMTGASRLS